MHLAENSIQNIVRLLLLWQHIVHGLPEATWSLKYWIKYT